MSKGILAGLEPTKVWQYFEAICEIPHGSGNEKYISEYLEKFAQDNHFTYKRDEYNNVIIWADGTLGLESHEPVILQGHMDMVAEKTPDCTINMETEGLQLAVDGDKVLAKGTTLGGDDGIAVAYMLALLDDMTTGNPQIKHPPLECVITVDEERGMTGAANLDMSLLKGHTMINLDSEDEGYLLVSCAGGVAATVQVPFNRVDDNDYEKKTSKVKVTISGLTGGHSGCEIQKGRANANILMGQLLEEVCDMDYNALIYALNGGSKDNVITPLSEAVIAVEDLSELSGVIEEMNELFLKEYAETDPGIKITMEPFDYDCAPMDYDSRDNILAALNTLPNGVQKMSPDIEDLPETSLNLGVMKTSDNSVNLTYLIRSNVDSAKDELKEKVIDIAQSLGATVTCDGDYPGWAYRKVSNLRDIMVKSFADMYGREPVVQAIHAGVECGMFANKIADFDAVSIGPDMEDIHTPNERLHIESTSRVWEYLLEVLSRL